MLSDVIAKTTGSKFFIFVTILKQKQIFESRFHLIAFNNACTCQMHILFHRKTLLFYFNITVPSQHILYPKLILSNFFTLVCFLEIIKKI